MVVIIIVLQLVYFFVDFSPSPAVSKVDKEELVKFQNAIDSIKLASTVKDSARIFPFNPNFITDYRGYILGMSTEEIDLLHEHREQDKWVNSSDEFQKVTGVSDSLLRVISPYFQFPQWATPSRTVRREGPVSGITGEASEKNDLNTATVEDLMRVRGIGEVLAARIVNYRNKIGSFVDDLQLNDVYGLNFEVRQEVLSQYTVKTPPEIKVVNINHANVLELSNVPYISYELAREILDYRLLHEKITTFEELAKIKDFPSEKIDRIALYLTLK